MSEQEQMLIDIINEYFGCDSAYFGIHTLDFAKWLIDHDVVKVVRCKDCKYFGREVRDGKHQCKNHIMAFCFEDDYCNYGERLVTDDA